MLVNELIVIERALAARHAFNLHSHNTARIFLDNKMEMFINLNQGQANDWVAEAVKDIHVRGPAGALLSAPTTDSDATATLLPILQAQRERFR